MFQEQMNTENASVRAKAQLVNAKQEQQSVLAAQNLHEISNSFSAVQTVICQPLPLAICNTTQLAILVYHSFTPSA